MDKAFEKQAEEWFERGRHDIETAQLLYDERGYTDSIAYHIQQAVEKYLKGYLVLHGKKPPKIHELDSLLNHIAAFDDSFNDFLELCEKASRYYIEDRYPPGPCGTRIRRDQGRFGQSVGADKKGPRKIRELT